MPMKYEKFISREMVQSSPETLFIFGDNLKRRGFGGQAREMRGEANAVGLPTKRQPDNLKDSFLSDDNLSEVRLVTGPDMERLRAHLKKGGLVIWPEDGIGTGLAKLNTSSPAIFKFYEAFKKELEKIKC